MKVSIHNFFQSYYDLKIFYPVIAGQVKKWFYIDILYDNNVKIDKTFSSINRNIFREELLAARLEIIGLVFTHTVNKKNLLLNQLLFTQEYLQKNAQLKIWEIMGAYNQAIMLSMDIEKNEKEVMKICKRRQTLLEEYEKKYTKNPVYTSYIERICNRVDSEEAWEKHHTLMSLTARIAHRVDCNAGIHQSTLINIMSMISGYYQAAKKAILFVQFR
jgi:hypothetical protein